MTEEEIESIKTIIANPRSFNIPDWFLNKQKDRKQGKWGQDVSNGLDTQLRDNFERMKKIRCLIIVITSTLTSSFELLLIFLFLYIFTNTQHPHAPSDFTKVSATTGASRSVVSTPRPLVAAPSDAVPRTSKSCNQDKRSATCRNVIKNFKKKKATKKS